MQVKLISWDILVPPFKSENLYVANGKNNSWKQMAYSLVNSFSRQRNIFKTSPLAVTQTSFSNRTTSITISHMFQILKNMNECPLLCVMDWFILQGSVRRSPRFPPDARTSILNPEFPDEAATLQRRRRYYLRSRRTNKIWKLAKHSRSENFSFFHYTLKNWISFLNWD